MVEIMQAPTSFTVTVILLCLLLVAAHQCLAQLMVLNLDLAIMPNLAIPVEFKAPHVVVAGTLLTFLFAPCALMPYPSPFHYPFEILNKTKVRILQNWSSLMTRLSPHARKNKNKTLLLRKHKYLDTI